MFTPHAALLAFVFFMSFFFRLNEEKAFSFEGPEESMMGGPPKTKVSLKSQIFPNDFSLQSHDFSLSTPLVKEEPLIFTSSIKSGAVIHGSSLKKSDGSLFVPTQLSNFELGLSCRRQFGEEMTLGGQLSYGSASDQIFSNWRVNTLTASLYESIPSDYSGRWIFSLYYSNNSTFLPGVPLPGVMHMKANRDLFLLLGFPLTSLRWSPDSQWTFSASILGPVGIKTEASYGNFKEGQYFSSLDWEQRSWMMKDRSDPDDRLVLSEKKFQTGYRFLAGGFVPLNFSLGFAFDRSYANSKGFTKPTTDRQWINDSWMASFSTQLRF